MLKHLNLSRLYMRSSCIHKQAANTHNHSLVQNEQSCMPFVCVGYVEKPALSVAGIVKELLIICV